MKAAYAMWIHAFLEKHNYFVRGKCEQAVKAMLKDFPELRKAAGFAHWVATDEDGSRAIRDQHFWCVTVDGTIVDPTKDQFVPPVRYEELDLADPATRAKVPTGRCRDCGSDVYAHDAFCNERCERAYASFVMGGPL